MPEGEWLSSTSPLAMLASLRASGKLADRKARLFAAACCRRIWSLLTEEGSRRAIEVAERWADGPTGREVLRAARADARAAWPVAGKSPATRAAWQVLNISAPEAAIQASSSACLAVGMVGNPTGRNPYMRERAARAAFEAAYAAEGEAQVSLMKDMISPGALPTASGWRGYATGVIPNLAQAAYDERELSAGTLQPARLAVLADALEEAGCTDLSILGHLRQRETDHVRGCWCMDLLLDRG